MISTLAWLTCAAWGFSVSTASAGTTSPVTFLFQGRKAIQKSQFDRGLRLLRRAYKGLPHWGIVRFELARALHLTGAEPAKVMAHLQFALKKAPTRRYPDVHAFAGVVFESAGDNDRALRHYARALSLGVLSARPCLRAARIWMQQQEAARAVTCLEKLYRRGLSRKSVTPLLARAYTETRRWENAATFWKRALSLHPRWLMLWKDGVSFFNLHYAKLPRKRRWVWRRYRSRIRRRLRKMMPRRRPRKLRPLRKSRR